MDRPKINVLVVDNSPGMTGAFRSIYNITTKIEDEFDFHYALPKSSTLVSILKDQNKSVIPVPFLEIQKNLKTLFYLPVLLYNSYLLLRYVHRYKIDIIHCNDLYNMSGVVCKLFNPKIRLAYFVRLMPDSYIRLVYRYFALLISWKADRIIAISGSVKKGLDNLNVPSEVISCHFVRQEKYPFKSSHKIQQAPTLLYLSNFMAGKGHIYAILALAKVKNEISGIKMIMAGGDLGLDKNKKLKEDMKQKAVQLKLEDNITFLDFTDDVEKLMKDSDIFLNFSESESFSMTCLEALSFGVPLIASDCGGPADLFENGKSGILVPNKNVGAMAEAILLLASNETLREQFAKEGKRYSSIKFDKEKSLKELRLVYQQLMDQPTV